MTPIVVIGDSLACPRPWEGVGLAQTYAYQLQLKLGPEYYVLNWAAGDNDSVRATSEGFLRTYVRASDAAYAVVQLGIVDCAPRLMSRVERLIGGASARIRGLRALSGAYIRFKARHRYSFTKWFPRTQVPAAIFAERMRSLLDELLRLRTMKRIYILTIAAPGAILVERSFGIRQNIDAYNEILRASAAVHGEKAAIVDVFAMTEAHPNWITDSDGHHITSQAHQYIAESIAASIRASEARA